MRTSITHPLKIAQVRPVQAMGAIGLTLCPGKTQRNASTGQWQRDLDIDLDAVAEWGAVVVVTLMEEHELHALQVADLGRKVADRHMEWLHLPISDVSTPSRAFEAQWAEMGEGLRARLRLGFNVLLHCMGGLGRSGTIAARLLVEMGWEPQTAVEAIREVRPGAIETRAQLEHVLAIRPVEEMWTDSSLEAMQDRAVGTMLGLAVGDAIGTTLEFKPRDSYPRLTDMVGGGPFALEPGQWTDDTAMAVALMDSLETCSDLDEADLMARFVKWLEEGDYSCTGRCFDIGITTRKALSRWKRTGNPVAGSTAPETAGNGSLMRLAPVLVRYWRDREKMRDLARRQSMTTHGAPEAVDACVAFSEVLADAINGRRKSEVFRPRDWPYAGSISAIMTGRWRGKHRSQVRSTGYVADTLEAALWCVARTSSFEDAVLLAANLGDDADTTAAIAGQLAGALYGASAIPERWLARLAWRERITAAAWRIVGPA